MNFVLGKSYALLADAAAGFNHPQFNGLLVRRTNDELRELKSKSQELYKEIWPKANFNKSDSEWTFPSGARLWMSYLEHDDDVKRYQGQAFTWIGFDELTQWSTPFAWNYLSSRLRTSASNLSTYMRACVDEGEVLTKSGWKDIQSIREGEEVYSVDKSGGLVVRKVTGFHAYDVEEPLVKVRKKNLYMSMTPDHRVVYKVFGQDQYKLVRFNEHQGKSIEVLRTSTEYVAQGYKSPITGFSDLEYAEFLGLYIAEGCTPTPRKGNYKVLITQNKEQNQMWVRRVMEASGLSVCYCKNGDFQITNKALHMHLAPLGKAHQKHFPRDFLSEANKEQLEIAFKAYAIGDGHWQSAKSCTLVTCSKQLADDLQEIAIKLGYRTQVNHKVLPSKAHNDRYTVYVTLRSPTTKVDKNPKGRNDVTYEPYKGKVYCLSVEETENFILRQQGYVWVSGNTTNPGGPGHCLPYGDVLTTKGWKDIKQVKVGDQVYSLDKDANLVIKTVADTVQEWYKGKMVSRKDQMVFTENHRLPFKSNSGRLEVRPFYNLPGQTNIYRAYSSSLIETSKDSFTVPTFKTRKTRLQQPDTITAKQYAELMGWFLSEGHTLDRDKEFGISQYKPYNRIVIEKLLTDCGFDFRISPKCFYVSSPKWWAYMRQFGKCRDKFIPDEIKSSAYLKEFFFTLMGGDGHWHNENSGTYYTTSERLKDDVMEVCVRLGYNVSFSPRVRETRFGPIYEISFSKRQTTEVNTGNHLYDVDTTNSKVNVEKTDYEGFVYCITVPETETFFVRQNGYVWVSGNTWVKKMFIDPAPWGQPFWATDIDTNEVMVEPDYVLRNGVYVPNPNAGKPLFKRRFIPSRLSDNPYLMATGDYERMLLSMPEVERKQLYEGDWDIAYGAAFPEFNRRVHVVPTFDIPHDWRRFRACDYGYGSAAAVVWFAITPEDQLIIYRELYVKKMLAVDLADNILYNEDGENISYGVLDSSCWHQRGDNGPSIAEQMIARGCRWRPSDRSKGSRKSGKQELHRRLQYDDDNKPGLLIMENCVNTIAQLPILPLDKNNPEDVDTKAEDHIYDAIRYGIMSRPRPMDWALASRQKRWTPVDNVFGY